MTWTSRSLAGAVALALALGGAGCAAGSAAGARPAPFPGAPRPDWTSPRAALGVVPLPAARVNAILEAALSLRGEPYVFGAASPSTGFDCSGLIWYVFASQALDLPRTTADQYRIGMTVDRSQIAPGDLVFFSTTEPGPSHVGLALDDHTLIHAPSTGSVVRVERFDTTYWQSRLLGVRRVFVSQIAGR